MEFKPNYKTEDGLFEVMIDKSKLTLDHPEVKAYWVSKEITLSDKITVYNTDTKALSQKSVYYNKKRGFYFKGHTFYYSYSYNIDELVVIESESEK
jgi:hypothetical protein